MLSKIRSMAFTSGHVWGLAGFCNASGTGGGVRDQELTQAPALLQFMLSQ